MPNNTPNTGELGFSFVVKGFDETVRKIKETDDSNLKLELTVASAFRETIDQFTERIQSGLEILGISKAPAIHFEGDAAEAKRKAHGMEDSVLDDDLKDMLGDITRSEVKDE